MNTAMNVSYLMITYNRRPGLLANLASVYAGDPQADVWVVDNGSTDGTADAVRASFPRARLLQLDKNIGMPARNVALRQMRSEYVVLLDDDSYPIGDAVARSVAYMNAHREVAAVVGRAVLPDGRGEASAFPGVLLGCATCLRLRAVRDVGFFPADFFRQAEEYDLAFRLWNAGYRIERFEDLVYRHDKQPSASRASKGVTCLDLKHNLILAARYLPEPYNEIYWTDFAQRYGAILRHAGHGAEFDRVIAEAEQVAFNDSQLRRQPLSDDAFEALFQHREQMRAIGRWAEANRVRRVAIVDVSKNLFATYQACQRFGLDVVAIVDDRPAFAGMKYRNVPVATSVPKVDGVVVSNVNPAQVDSITAATAARFEGPIMKLLTTLVMPPVFSQRAAA